MQNNAGRITSSLVITVPAHETQKGNAIMQICINFKRTVITPTQRSIDISRATNLATSRLRNVSAKTVTIIILSGPQLAAEAINAAQTNMFSLTMKQEHVQNPYRIKQDSSSKLLSVVSIQEWQ